MWAHDAEAVKGLIQLLKALRPPEPTIAPKPREPEPEPPAVRRADGGIDMNDIGRAADRQREARRLPRTPEQARGEGRYR
jgi:hypothetical protein